METKPNNNSHMIDEESTKETIRDTETCQNISEAPPNSDDEENLPPLDGGKQAWTVLFACAFIFPLSFGTMSSFGVFQEYYVSTLLNGKPNSTASDVSWIGSVQAMFTQLSGVICGALYDRVGARPIMIYGSCVYIISCMLISLCHTWWQLLLCQGILSGCSLSALFTPPYALLNQWFDKRRGLAYGIMTAFGSLGGVALPIILRALLDNVGFPWTFRILGFFALVNFSCALPFVKNREKITKPKAFLNFSAFKFPPFTLFAFGQLCNFFGFHFAMFYLPSLGVRYGLSQSMATYSLSILNSASLVGRLLNGIISDKIGRFNVMCISASCSGVVALSILAVNSSSGVFAIAAFYGFFVGQIITLQASCVPRLSKNPKQIGTNVGMMMGSTSITGLLAGPVAGWLLAYDNGAYTSAVTFAGCMLLIGSTFILTSKLLLERHPFAVI